MNTHCCGFNLISSKNITKQDFVYLCDNLEKDFNEIYNTQEFSFSPELITEGGIIFNNYENNDGYKSMRLYFCDKNYIGVRTNNLYNFINKEIKNEWVNNNNILIKKNEYLGTFLKSRNKAPKWNNKDLEIFEKCFNNIGLIIDRIPTKKQLRAYSKESVNLFY